MAVPVTPKVGCDTFVTNDRNEVCLVRRADNGLWAMPGGYQDLGETPAECARREFVEETGLEIQITELVGLFSSLRYDSTTNVNRGRELTQPLFRGHVVGGRERPSEETSEVGWFSKDDLPPLSDGHASRLEVGFRALENVHAGVYFE
jgi:ADP-ribose pyrophosphatase YjhB (NUDIX family)